MSLLEGRSNKAYRLARMRAVGMPVPDGVLLTPEFLARFAAASEPARQRQLDWLWRRFAGRLLAGRSAAGNEDGANHKFQEMAPIRAPNITDSDWVDCRQILPVLSAAWANTCRSLWLKNRAYTPSPGEFRG